MNTSVILASALLCSGMSTGQDFAIRMSTGKSKYIPDEPIYFKLILSNASQKYIGYDSPLSMGVGSFTFCEEISKRCIQDADVMHQPIKAPMVGNLAPGKSYRILGTLNAGQASFLLGTNSGRKMLVVKPTLIIDAGIKKQSSEPWPIEIVPGNPDDDSLASELKRFGSLGLHDNAGGSGIYSIGLPMEGKKKAVEIYRATAKYPRSHLYPYLLSYFTEFDPAGLSQAEKEAMGAYVNRESVDGNGANGEYDPILRLFNLLRCVKECHDKAVPRCSAKPCYESVLKDLEGKGRSEFFSEPGIAAEQIEDYDLVRILRPDIFSKDLGFFHSSGVFDPKWKDMP